MWTKKLLCGEKAAVESDKRPCIQNKGGVVGDLKGSPQATIGSPTPPAVNLQWIHANWSA